MRQNEAKVNWPKFLIMKGFVTTDTQLTKRESVQYPNLVLIERDLQFLDKTVNKHFDAVCSDIERIRSSKNLSQTKISNFAKRCQDAFFFFRESTQIIDNLANHLLAEVESKRLKKLFQYNFDNFKSSLDHLITHFDAHVSVKMNSTPPQFKVQLSHLPKLRKNFEEVCSAFSSTTAPLQLVFSQVLQPIQAAREQFFLSQMYQVAKAGPKIAEIANEMEEIIERRARLETGANNLDKMFDVLVKFKNFSFDSEQEEPSSSCSSFEIHGMPLIDVF